ncbi:metallophosphoesterase [Pontibacter cellulosilyticus]|uniref:Metallophosphoesterase n=1 Tax=Pontibacter cellulosilyticus TaxID=1720253 RepID=A0A923SHT3_9BACT|nr:metallophosphoesterase [Pontibacter cellulosilyticus]MBC5991882.1 metallophosphoesterase [Pontibacter cellulosilyticus]
MKKKKLIWVGSALAFVGAALFVDALILEKYFFDVRTFRIGKNNSERSIKIVLITDLHFKDRLLPHYKRLARKLNQLQLDLLLITGDTIDSTGKLEPVIGFFKLLNQQMRKVAIPGNNDYKASTSIDDLEKALEKCGCDFLRNESKAYIIEGERIMVTGLDDMIEGESSFRDAVKEIGSEENHILLLHSPLQQEKIKAEISSINKERDNSNKLNIRYIFAGHTHGGQVRLPGYVPVLPGQSGNYVNGWYNSSAPYLYVSKGFGTSTIPFRFFARSEVTVFHYFL